MITDVVHQFIAYLLTEKRVSHNTFAAYRRDIQQFVFFVRQQSLDLEQLTLKDMKNFLKYLKDLSLSSRSMSRKISSLKTFYGYLERYHRWPNLAAELTFPKLEKRLPSYLTEQEIEHLLKIAGADNSDLAIRNKVMLYLLYVSGMRISELINLHLSDIHFDTGFIGVTGKGGKGRMIPVPEPMLAMLKKYLDTVYHNFVYKKTKKRATDFLFPVSYGGKIKAITRQAFWGILKVLWKKTGNPKSISPHKLRHSLATHMLKNGADLRSLQLLLGHENLSTVQIYTHLETSYLRSVYDKKHPRS